jgi:bifunctional oligoribonuclease and PAP phosphatase NrnA
MSGRHHPAVDVPDSRRSQLLEILHRVRAARRIVLTTHHNADGDGAGSQAAFAAWAEAHGAQVTIVNPTPFPPNLRFLLHREGLVAELDDARSREAIRAADLAIVLDTSEPRRIEPLDELLGSVPILVVDHHPPGPEGVGEYGIQDPSAAAVGELVYDLITLAGDEWPQAAVLGVYVAIVSDTGSFRFSNTTPRTHGIASEMLVRGVDPESVYEKLFATAPLRRLELLREALARLGTDPDYGLAWIAIPADVPHRLGSTPDDFDGLIEQVRSIEGTRVALIFRETREGETKVSLRSSGAVDVNRVARGFGGGGHVKASGATLPLPLDDAVRVVLGGIRAAMDGPESEAAPS